jgi:hypothetical protein
MSGKASKTDVQREITLDKRANQLEKTIEDSASDLEIMSKDVSPKFQLNDDSLRAHRSSTKIRAPIYGRESI